jgi:hypothetical protein
MFLSLNVILIQSKMPPKLTFCFARSIESLLKMSEISSLLDIPEVFEVGLQNTQSLCKLNMNLILYSVMFFSWQIEPLPRFY